MKCQSLFSGKSKKTIVYLLSAELAQRVVKIKGIHYPSRLIFPFYGLKLTLKVPSRIIADDSLICLLLFFEENMA